MDPTSRLPDEDASGVEAERRERDGQNAPPPKTSKETLEEDRGKRVIYYLS